MENLTVIETATDSVVARIPAGGARLGYRLVDLGIPDRLMIPVNWSALVVDAKENTRVASVSAMKLGLDFDVEPAVAAVDTTAWRVFLMSSSAVMAVDLRKGVEVGMVKKQDHPRFVLWTRP
jgi:hypothetical protein